jgi:plastocyanin
MDHDFSVPDWAVRTRLIEDVGEDVVTFTVPDGRRAPATYACTPHSKMMRGTVEVD